MAGFTALIDDHAKWLVIDQCDPEVAGYNGPLCQQPFSAWLSWQQLQTREHQYAETLPQQTPNTHPMLVQCWASVADVGPTLIQHWISVSCWGALPPSPQYLHTQYRLRVGPTSVMLSQHVAGIVPPLHAGYERPSRSLTFTDHCPGEKACPAWRFLLQLFSLQQHCCHSRDVPSKWYSVLKF